MAPSRVAEGCPGERVLRLRGPHILVNLSPVLCHVTRGDALEVPPNPKTS